MRVWEVVKGAALAGAAVAATMAAPSAFAQQYSVWLVENSRFMGVPYGAFMPDRTFVPGSTNKFNNINTVDLPVNVGVIKGMVNGKLEVVLADCGWKQQDYHKMTGTQHWTPLTEQLKLLGITPDQVTKIVIGHGHWDHAGSLSDFPNAVLYVQRKELEGITWALNYPEPHIRADNIAGCFRTPACGYPPKTLDEIYGKVLGQKAVIVDGDGQFDVLPGIKIHPAWHSHTAGAQLLEVRTGGSVGTLVFGSDTYSSWQGIRDWMVANIQSSTDSAQQFLAYEKCYKLTNNNMNNCIAAHEPTSYTSQYPITSNSWVAGSGESRMAEITLAPGETSKKPR